jgi:hypothetical protein
MGLKNRKYNTRLEYIEDKLASLRATYAKILVENHRLKDENERIRAEVEGLIDLAARNVIDLTNLPLEDTDGRDQ